MVPVAALTIFALLLARVVRAPAGTWRYVIGVATLALLASQLLPAGNAMRADVAGSARTLFWVGLGLAPVAAYAVLVRGLRRRAGADMGAGRPISPPRGLVQFDADAALTAETAAELEAEARAVLPGARLSLGWRGEAGALDGHLRMRLGGELAEVEMLRVVPAARGRGVGRALLGGAEGEAAARGARRIGAVVGDWQAPAFFERLGYAPGAPLDLGGGLRRRWMEKAL